MTIASWQQTAIFVRWRRPQAARATKKNFFVFAVKMDVSLLPEFMDGYMGAAKMAVSRVCVQK